MNITIKNLTNKNDVNEMVENGIILTDDEVKAIVKEHNKTAGFFGKKSERGILKAYRLNVKVASKNMEPKKESRSFKEIYNEVKGDKMTSIAEENQLLNVLNNIAVNGTTKRVKRDIPVCIDELATLPNPEQLFVEDNTHTLLADLHIIRNILNNQKYFNGNNFREAWDMNGDSEMVPASQYMSVAFELNNINKVLHVKKLGYEMPSKDWEYLSLVAITNLVNINLKGFRSFDVEFDDDCDLKHVLKVMLGAFEAINDFENAEEVKRVLNNL